MSKRRKRTIRRQNGFRWTVPMAAHTFEVSTIGTYRDINRERGPLTVEIVHVQPNSVQVVLARGAVRLVASVHQPGQVCDHHRCMVAAVLVPLNIRPVDVGYDVSSHNGHTSATLKVRFGKKGARTRLSVATGEAPAAAVAHAAARLANETWGIL